MEKMFSGFGIAVLSAVFFGGFGIGCLISLYTLVSLINMGALK